MTLRKPADVAWTNTALVLFVQSEKTRQVAATAEIDVPAALSAVSPPSFGAAEEPRLRAAHRIEERLRPGDAVAGPSVA